MSRPFTKEMKADYTLLLPNMAKIHFELLEAVIKKEGYKCLLLDNQGPEVIQNGLKYVHNDMCYPALLVIGQLIDAISKKLVDPKKCAVCITQTGGGCRASNYYNLLIKALERAGYPEIPVISLNLNGMNSNPGIHFTLMSFVKAFSAVLYGDLIMMMKNQVKPYEINKGDADKVARKWIDHLSHDYSTNNRVLGKKLRRNYFRIAEDFAAVPVCRTPKVKVGIVGEIYMKYASLGNNNLEDFLASEDCEVMLLPVIGFVLYGFSNGIYDYKYYGRGKFYSRFLRFIALPFIRHYEELLSRAIESQPGFRAPAHIAEVQEYASRFIDLGCKMGEGWLLTGEMIELIEKGYNNIISTQPFGCLPNHIVAKGMIRPIKTAYPDANIVPIDYDPSMTKVNQENRIKLMLSVAREKLAEEQKATNS
jgi:Uncharacterized protein conserved in bacteria